MRLKPIPRDFVDTNKGCNTPPDLWIRVNLIPPSPILAEVTALLKSVWGSKHTNALTGRIACYLILRRARLDKQLVGEGTPGLLILFRHSDCYHWINFLYLTVVRKVLAKLILEWQVTELLSASIDPVPIDSKAAAIGIELLRKRDHLVWFPPSVSFEPDQKLTGK